MKKEVGGYNYLNELEFKSVLWKMSEISWKKFKDFSKAEGIVTMLRLIWYKKASEDMKSINYVFEDINGDISELCSSARIACATDVFLENEDESGYVAEGEEGDETDADERSSDGGDESDDDKPPREEDEHEESEDEAHTSKNEKQDIGDDRNDKHDLGGDFNENQGANKGIGNVVDNGNDEIILDAGNGGGDDIFQSLFEEATRRSPKLNEVTRKLVVEQAKEERDEEESDPEFGLEDVQYPDTPNSILDLKFKDQLLRYSLNTQYDVKMAKSEATRIAAICCKSDCPWRVYCSVERPLNKWMVKVCHNKHNHGKSSRVSMLKQGVIAGLFREEIRRNINLQAAEIKDMIKERYNIVVNISKCYKARRIALDTVLEAQTIQFGKLWDYEAELKRSNKGVTTEICTGDTSNWYPIAWAVVKRENKDTWGWFVRKLKIDLNLGIGNNLTIISDKQKGIIHAKAAELPKAEHPYSYHEGEYGPVRLSIQLIHLDGTEPLVRLDTKSTTHPNGSVE
ncbi:Uncharacterized protein Rs2_45915 [Raphanus sativus]|nr:Uncharacterized protein Rs2_45915 [Raphanus sativus]